MTSINQKGGIFVGKSHAQGGIDITIPETGQQIEVEGNEPLIPREALQDETIKTYTGTNFDILNQINTSIGAKNITQKATSVHAGDVIICKKTLHDKTVKTLQGTNKQIVSAINENAGCNVIEPGAKMKTETGEIVQFKDGGTVAEKNNLYQEWKKLVNMTKKELEDFRKTPEGKKAGLTKTQAKKKGITSGQESAEWILKMKDTHKEEWTDEMWGWAKKQINFIKRMSGVKGPLYDKKGNKTRKHTALLIWGHNPEKETKMENGGAAKNEIITRELKSADVETGKPISFYYLHTKNKQKTPFYGAKFGQNIEPHGKYIVSISESAHKLQDDERNAYEYGIISFKNPLVLEHKSTDDKGWKKDISDMFGGKKGKKLSEEIIKKGYDGIITTDGEWTSEIVSLKDYKFENGGTTQIPMNDLLTDLYKDHHEAWDFMEKISREVNENNCSECAKKIISLFHKELNHHFNEEENDFFPWVLQQENNTLNKLIVDELIEQHHWFISRIKLMEENPSAEKIKEFCNKLIEHIKLEEYLMNKFKQDPFKNTDMENQIITGKEYRVAPTHFSIPNKIVKVIDENPNQDEMVKVEYYRNGEFEEDMINKNALVELDNEIKDKKDTITMNIPLLIRTLELAREDMETDAELHHMVERLIELKDKEVLTMDDYNFIEGVENNPKIKKYRYGGAVSKEGYERKREWAARRMKENKKIKTLTETQHEALEELASIRHEIHSNKKSVIISDEQGLKKKLIKVNESLLNSGLTPMEFVPTSNEDYIDIDTIDELYEIEDVPEDDEEREDWYDENYMRISGELEDLNTKIEDYMRKIDAIYGTNYAPSGMSRVFEKGGELPTNQQVKLFLEEIGEELHYLYDKPVHTWDEYDTSNWIAKVKKYTKMKNDGQLPTSNELASSTKLNIKHQTSYDEFKVIFEDEKGKPQEEIHIYYSDALASFNKHKEQNHYARLEGWDENGEFNVVFRTPRFKEGDKVQMFDEEPVLTITEVIEWSDKSPTYNLSSANGVIDRRNISETKITKANKQFADGGEISEKEAFKKLMEPKTIEELKNSIDKIKKEFEEKKNSKEYQPYRDIPNYGTAIYVAQSNFFSYIVSYQPEMLTPFLEVIQSVPKANRFKLNRIFEIHPDESVTRFLENIKEPLWKLIPTSFRNVAKVNQLPFKPEPDNKHLATITDLFVGKDGLRQTMTGVYFDTKNNKVVATNAHIMLIINAKPIIKEEAICYMSNTKSKLFKELEGNEQIISKTKDGCYQIEGTYPRYDAVVPTEFNEVITVNTYNLYKFCAIALKADLVRPITNQILVRVNNEMEVGFNADFLAKSLKAMLFLGHDMVDLCFINKNKALVIVPKGKSREISYSGGINTDLVLVMPLGGLENTEDNYFSYNLMDNCIYNHGKLESLGCVNINDDTEVASVKNGTTEFKKGDFVHKKNTNNKHYIVDAVNSNKLDLINTVSLKKLSGVNAVDYVLVKPEEVEDVEYAYDFYKRKKETEELKKKHPIVLEWTEGADIRNKTYTYLEELEKDLKSFGFTDRPTETYIKNKVWIKGYPYYILIDLSKMDHDFNPEEEKLITWLKNYNKSFDFEQFSSEAEKKNKERAAEKKRLQQAQREKVEKQTLEAIQVLETLQNLTFEAEEKANIQKEIEALKGKMGEEANDKSIKATLTFPNRLQAEEFATKWARYSKRGHIVGAGTENVPVTIYDLTEKDKEWVDNYVNQLNSSNQDVTDQKEKKVVRDNYYITSFGGNFTEVNPLKTLTIEGIDVFIYEYDYDKELIGIAHLPTGLVLTGSSYKGKEDYLINQLKGMIKDVGKQKLLSKLDSSKLSPRYDINSLPFEEKNFQDIKKLYEDKNFEELYKYISNNQNITSRQSLSKILNKNIVKYNKKEIIDLFKSFGYDVEKIENEKRLLEEEGKRKELEEKNNKVATYKKEEYPYLKLENMSAKQFAILDKAMQKQWRFQDDGIMTLSNWIKKHKDDIIGVKESVSKYTKRGEERTSPLTEYFLEYNKDNSVYLRDIPKLAYDNWNKEWNKTKLKTEAQPTN